MYIPLLCRGFCWCSDLWPDRTEHLKRTKQAKFLLSASSVRLMKYACERLMGGGWKIIAPWCIWHRIRETVTVWWTERNIALFSYLWLAVVFSSAINIQKQCLEAACDSDELSVPCSNIDELANKSCSNKTDRCWNLQNQPCICISVLFRKRYY